uniref:RNA helicase n=1 Tax=Sphaeramia orbicularis TaxID=375764 RepID=A0A673A182_9TELE
CEGRGRFGRGGKTRVIIKEFTSENAGSDLSGERFQLQHTWFMVFLLGPRVTYIPPTISNDENSVFAHYKSGINFDKYDDILVDVSGSNPPKAIMTFEEAGLCDSLKKNVSKSGYVKPTPVQKHGIPIISAGRDLMACAQTGSGKTVTVLDRLKMNDFSLFVFFQFIYFMIVVF